MYMSILYPMFNLQHFAIHNVSSAILYGAIGIDLLLVRQNSYGFERSGPRQCDVQLAMCEDCSGRNNPTNYAYFLHALMWNDRMK